jgi:hypothetical protein
MKRLIFIVLLIVILPIHSIYALNGNYKVTIDVVELNSASNTLTANLIYEVFINDTVASSCYIPLAFRYSPETIYIIEPTSDYLTILIGYLLPEKNLGISNIIYSKGNFEIKFSFKNVVFELNESITSNELKVLNYQSNLSIKVISNVIDSSKILPLSELTIKSNNFQYSIPQESPSNGSNLHIIKNANLGDIRVFFKPTEKQIFLYIFLGILGLLIGFGATPKFIQTTRGAVIWLLISFLCLGGLLFVFFSIITPTQRINDTTTIVTVGSALGLIVGVLTRAIVFLIPSKKKEKSEKDTEEKTPANTVYK